MTQETTHYLHFDHSCLGSRPLPCPSKEHAAWLARQLSQVELDVCCIENGDPDVEGSQDPSEQELWDLYHLEDTLLVADPDTKVNGNGGMYSTFWITEA